MGSIPNAEANHDRDGMDGGVKPSHDDADYCVTALSVTSCVQAPSGCMVMIF